ncbi:hypothetical protein LL033_14490 [Clostridium estertheticum]|uniref:hypothetical protein n=1 Tax=Clostridium estertheticum TaxID=238834 RepID=UPI001C0D6F5A|nr:hypothetical protein [Clostridium estertheticum]MBU3218144.1 hypothetical protein [Clostridium estertheticum]WAG53859.1 hypothetical protein LL033_14490 [Clostridium estertheticum]
MSLLKDIILEESQRNFLMQDEYKTKINELPKGKMCIKKVGKNEYYYLKYRDGKKTVTDYVGKDEKKIDEVEKQIKKRKHFEKMLEELKIENILIQKVIGGCV